jgi:uncharacterized membrane protein
MSIGRTLARGLGLFSLLLGAVQLLAPRSFLSSIGVRPREGRLGLTRLLGVRELAAGAGLVLSRNPGAWPWVRVAGDVMDIALLGRAMASPDSHRPRVTTALGSVVAITALDALAGLMVPGESPPRGSATTTEEGSRRVRRAVTVRVPRRQAYDLWRDFANLPRFMTHVEEVRVLDERRSHWVAKAPLGRTVEWDAEITEDRPGESIAWRSTDGSQIANSGRVRFTDAPGDRGTEVHVELEYAPPLGPVGATLAQLLGEEPARQAADDLRRFKQVVETGRVPWSDATIEDRRLAQRPAQPPEQPVREPVGAHA